MENSKDKLQQEAARVLEKTFRGSIDGSMGVGKTRMGVEDIDRHYTDYFRVLVVGPKRSTFKAWKKELKELDKEYLQDHITFVTYKSLPKADLDYDVVYLDEVHNLTATHESWLAQFKGKIRGFTGTSPSHKTSTKYKLIDKYCPVVFNYGTDKAVQDGILNDYEIIVHMMPLNTAKDIPVKTKNGEFYTSEVASYEWWTQKLYNATSAKDESLIRIMRMKALQSFKTKERYVEVLLRRVRNKCLIFANTKKQADIVCKYRYYSGYKDSENNLELFSTGMIRRLSCVEQLSESVNIPELRELIIMHSYSSDAKTPQKLGRGLRLEVGDKATIHILCYKGTVDYEWVKQALSKFDNSKITYKDAEW